MYCLQWLIPVLLIPKPVNPALLTNHVMFMGLYLTGFFLERKPCTICTVVFLLALALLCASNGDNNDFMSFLFGDDGHDDYWMAHEQEEAQANSATADDCAEEVAEAISVES